MNQSERSRLAQRLTLGELYVILRGRQGGHVARRDYDEGVQTWLGQGGQRIGGVGDAASALRFLCIVVRSQLGIYDKQELAAALSMLQSALSMLVILGSEDAHDVGIYLQTLGSSLGGDNG